MNIEEIFGQSKQEIADSILKDHKNFLEANQARLTQVQVNYAMLSGNHNKIATKAGSGAMLEDVYRPYDLVTRQQTNYSFDKIEDALREIVPAYMEAIPGIGVIPTTTNPAQSENQDIAEKFIEFHKEKVWCVDRLLMFDIIPNGYPGGACYVMMYPKQVGTKKVAYQNGEPYLNHIVPGQPQPDGTMSAQNELPVRVNNDGTLNVGGKDVAPEEIGCTIEERPETLMSLMVLPVFDLSVQGRISTSMRDCYSFTVKTIKSIGEIKKIWPKADLKSFLENIQVEQSTPPVTGTDKYLSEAGFGKPTYGTLRGNARLVEVYQKFINPCADFESGAILTSLGTHGDGMEPSSNSILIDVAKELPWKNPKTKKGLPPVVWFPFGFLRYGTVIPIADMEKAEGAQRGLDRVCNAMIASAAYKAQPVTFVPYGMEFLASDNSWCDKIAYPPPGTQVNYKKSTLPGLENEKPFTKLDVGDVDPAAIRLFEDQLMSATHVRTNQGKAPKSISGESAQIQYTLDQRDLGPIQKAHEQAWFELYELLISAATTEYYKGQPFLIPEKDSYQVLEWNQEIFGDDYDYVMVSKINKPVTKKARLEVISTLANIYAQLGQINPEMAEKFPLDRMFETMDITEMGLAENEKLPSLVKTKWELARMMSGNTVEPPLKEDDHKMHASSDLAEIQSVRFLTLDPAIKAAIMDHYNKHLLELDTMNQLKMQQVQQQSAAQEMGRQQLQIQNQPQVGEPTKEGM